MAHFLTFKWPYSFMLCRVHSDIININELEEGTNHLESHPGEGRCSQELYRTTILQDAHSGTAEKGVLRPAQYQNGPYGTHIAPAALDQETDQPRRGQTTSGGEEKDIHLRFQIGQDYREGSLRGSSTLQME